MKLLFITPFNPFPPFWGGGTRTYNLLDHLAHANQLDLIYPTYQQFDNCSGVKYRRALEERGVSIHGIGPASSLIQYVNPLMALKAVNLSFSKNLDAVISDYPWSGLYSLLLKHLAKVPFVLLEHNVEYLVTKQTHYEDPALTRVLETKVSAAAESVFCVSEGDKKRLNEILEVDKEKISILRNGYDAGRFQPDEESGLELKKSLGLTGDPVVLFYGKMDYLPNREAVEIIRKEIAPQVLEERPRTKFLIVGGGYQFSSDEDLDGTMIYTGVVDNIEDYVNAADVVIIPIEKGGGTRIKLIESVACNKDVVSTGKGAEEIIDKHTAKFVKVANIGRDFAEKIIELLDRPDPKVSDEFKQKYAWKNIFEGIEDKLEDILD